MIQQTYFLWFGSRLEIGTICWDQAPLALDRVADEGVLDDWFSRGFAILPSSKVDCILVNGTCSG